MARYDAAIPCKRDVRVGKAYGLENMKKKELTHRVIRRRLRRSDGHVGMCARKVAAQSCPDVDAVYTGGRNPLQAVAQRNGRNSADARS